MSAYEVAVVIATKDRPELLQERALRSVFEQSVLPSYLVVVDDSSEEVQVINRRIIESVPSDIICVNYLINRRTPGASGAWNTAVDYLCSQHAVDWDSLFLAFLDDDDTWQPLYLERCMTAAVATESNMVAAGFYRIEDNGQQPVKCLPPALLHEDLFLRGNPGIQGSNLFISLDILLMAGCFDEHLPSCTDRDLCIRLCELKAVRYHGMNSVLLSHYAESNRVRLSSPQLSAKTEGLDRFWQKYNGRMNNLQRIAFLERAQQLFHWQPDTKKEAVVFSEQHSQRNYLALTLGVDLGFLTIIRIRQLIELIFQTCQSHLVGFNLVLTAAVDVNGSDIKELIVFAEAKGITCYNLCSIKVCVEIATACVARENIGHSPWVLMASQPLMPLKGEYGNDIARLLVEFGAHPISQEASERLQSNEQSQLTVKMQECRIEAARARISRLFDSHKLRFLGMGSEAIVMTDGQRVFKCIDYWKNRFPDKQKQLLKKQGSQWHGLPGLYGLDEVVSDGAALVLVYPYEESTPYKGGYYEQVINLLFSCSRAGIVCNNIDPKNLVKTPGEVKLIDYGSDIRPWTALGFEHMARRAFLTAHYHDHPQLKQLMRKAMKTTALPELENYQAFREELVGIDCDLSAARQSSLPLSLPPAPITPFTLTIGVISGDAGKLLPLLNSIAAIEECDFLSKVTTLVLCNGCSAGELKAVLERSRRPVGTVYIISEDQQVKDAEQGVFGPDLSSRPKEQVSIANARSMLQKYVGLACSKSKENYAWILDDDMRLDERAKQYLAWLPAFKEIGVDVLIGQYEGASPNPSLNGMRTQLQDLLHNLRWLNQLPDNNELPDRSDINTVLRQEYPDYYYDLSRKHTAHLEVPFWLEPAYKGETVAEARARLVACAPLLVTGFPLTRSIIPVCSGNPLSTAKDTVNRGGNTFVLNPQALIQAPNLSPRLNGRESRRSDMIWAMINKYYYGLSIKTAPFPVLHCGRVQPEKILRLNKVADEIIGSALYAGLQNFFAGKKQHDLIFTSDDITQVWQATRVAVNTRLLRLRQSLYRINGLAQALSEFPELTELQEYLSGLFHSNAFAELEAQVQQMNERSIREFLKDIVYQSLRFENGAPMHAFESNVLN